MKSVENLIFSLSSEFLSAQALNATVSSRQAPPRRELDRLSRVFEHGFQLLNFIFVKTISTFFLVKKKISTSIAVSYVPIDENHGNNLG